MVGCCGTRASRGSFTETAGDDDAAQLGVRSGKMTQITGVAALWLAVGFALVGAIVSALRLTDMPRPRA